MTNQTKTEKPPANCPVDGCGGEWQLVDGDIHYHSTFDFAIAEDGTVKVSDDARYEDSGKDGSLVVERFLECVKCYYQWEIISEGKEV